MVMMAAKPRPTVRASVHRGEVGIWVTASVSHHLCHPENDLPAECLQPQDDAPSVPSARGALHIETSHY